MSTTGVSIFDLDTLQPVFIGSVTTKAKETHGVRLNDIREYLKGLIAEYPPYEVAIEQAFTRFNKATQVIYRVHGICNELFHEYEQFYYAPTTVKKIVSGNGQSKKDVVQQAILKRFPDIEFENEDQSDSSGVAISHLITKHKMKW